MMIVTPHRICDLTSDQVLSIFEGIKINKLEKTSIRSIFMKRNTKKSSKRELVLKITFRDKIEDTGYHFYFDSIELSVGKYGKYRICFKKHNTKNVRSYERELNLVLSCDEYLRIQRELNLIKLGI